MQGVKLYTTRIIAGFILTKILYGLAARNQLMIWVVIDPQNRSTMTARY